MTIGGSGKKTDVDFQGRGVVGDPLSLSTPSGCWEKEGVIARQRRREPQTSGCLSGGSNAAFPEYLGAYLGQPSNFTGHCGRV